MTNVKTHNVAFAWAGILAAAAFSIVWLAASSLDPSWVFGQDVLSDFGISGTDAELYFNYGCAVTGVLIAIFGIGIIVNHINAGHIVGGTLLIIGGILVLLVGLVPLDSLGGDIHTRLGYLFGIVAFAAAASTAAGNWASGQRVFGGLTLVLLIASTAMYLSYEFAEFESYVTIIALIWLVLESIALMLRKKKD
jgi:hypothetical membrane protein